MFVELISPERVVFQGEVKSLVLPGAEGDMTILPGHAPLVTVLRPGMIFATDAQGKPRRAFAMRGLVEVTPAKVTILSDRVIGVEELTEGRIREEITYLRVTREEASSESARTQIDSTIGQLEEFIASMKL